MMRSDLVVVLVAVASDDDRPAESLEHLGLQYIATHLRSHGYKCHLTVARTVEDLACYIAKSGPKIFGFSLLCANAAPVKTLAMGVKSRDSDATIIVGGHSATWLGKEVLEEMQEVDIVVIGEGEETMLEIVRAIERHEDLAGCRGILYRSGIDIEATPMRTPIMDLESLPFPARDIFEASSPRPPYVGVVSSRGCMAHCAFCARMPSQSNLPRWRGLSPRRCVDEIQCLKEKYGIKYFHFLDPSFEDAVPEGKARVTAFCDELIDRQLDVQFLVNTRSETWREEDRTLLSRMRKAGLESMLLGLEFGNDTQLQFYAKKARVADHERAMRLLREQGILLRIGFINIQPYSTLTDLRENAEFLRRNQLGSSLVVYFRQLQVYPGTAIERRLQQDRLWDGSGIGADRVWAYRYIDKRVERLGRLLRVTLQTYPEVHEYDFEEYRIRLLLRRATELAGRGEVAQGSAELEARIVECLDSLADSNYWFMRRVLYGVQEGWSDNRIESSVEQHIKGEFLSVRRDLMTAYLRLGRKLFCLDYRRIRNGSS